MSGTLGDHGVAIMSKRENMTFETDILSDSAALHGLVAAMVAASGAGIRVMRDPTRGGLAATLNELAQQSGVGFRIEEEAIPVRPGWRRPASCSVSIRSTSPTKASWSRSWRRRQRRPAGGDARASARQGRRDIGQVVADDHRFVQMTTSFGGGRIVDWLSGEQLPRIC